MENIFRNLYDMYPEIKNRLDLFEHKKYVFVYINPFIRAYSFNFSNSKNNYKELAHIPYFILIIAYRKSGKILDVIHLRKSVRKMYEEIVSEEKGE